MRGSAFGFFQDGSLTDEGLTSPRRRGWPSRTRKYQRWGGTVGGPIVQDKMHYFGSLERFAIDRPNTINIPARPELNGTELTQDRVWNTIVRGDHQVNSNNTYSVRWLRETSPQTNQIIAARVTARRPRARNRTSTRRCRRTSTRCCRNTKVNTLRLTWTRENVAFANPCFNSNGRDLSKCPPTLAFQDFIDQQDNTAQARINDGIQAEETLGWFLPEQARRPRHQVRRAVRVLRRRQHQPGQPERHVLVRHEQRPVQFVQPVDVSRPLLDPRRRTAERLREGPLLLRRSRRTSGAFTKDLTLSLGLRYDLERIPIAETGRSAGRRSIRPTTTTSSRASASTYDLNGGKSVVARRLRAILRQDAFRTDRRPVHRTPFSTSIDADVPGRGTGSRAAQRPVADRSVPGERTDGEPRAAGPRCFRAA